MPPTSDKTVSLIGRRMKLRDLQILLSVAQLGSMAKAASHLSTTQPTVSQAIADLEAAVGVRLFDRSTQGVVPTSYGDIMVKSALEAFDALSNGMRSLEFAAASGAGDVRLGCGEITIYRLAPTLIQRLAQSHPKITVHAAMVNPSDFAFTQLHERTLDLMIGVATHPGEDLLIETLFEESFVVAVSAQSPWARRRKVELSELMYEPWLYGEATNHTQARISERFRAMTGGLPHVATFTTSMSLRLLLLGSGNYISCIPRSIYQYGLEHHQLKALPIDIGLKVPIGLITLKNRTQSPAVNACISTARDVAKSITRSD